MRGADCYAERYQNDQAERLLAGKSPSAPDRIRLNDALERMEGRLPERRPGKRICALGYRRCRSNETYELSAVLPKPPSRCAPGYAVCLLPDNRPGLTVTAQDTGQRRGRSRRPG